MKNKTITYVAIVMAKKAKANKPTENIHKNFNL